MIRGRGRNDIWWVNMKRVERGQLCKGRPQFCSESKRWVSITSSHQSVPTQTAISNRTAPQTMADPQKLIKLPASHESYEKKDN